jgi:transposase
VAAMSIEAATSTPVFLAYLEQVLVPELKRTKPGAVVVMDNLRPPRADAVGRMLEAAGLGLIYLPRYSPDLNPIEPGWAKLKTRLRAKAARTTEALDAELGPALGTITARDAEGFFRHAGYALNRRKIRSNRAGGCRHRGGADAQYLAAAVRDPRRPQLSRAAARRTRGRDPGRDRAFAGGRTSGLKLPGAPLDEPDPGQEGAAVGRSLQPATLATAAARSGTPGRPSKAASRIRAFGPDRSPAKSAPAVARSLPPPLP